MRLLKRISQAVNANKFAFYCYLCDHVLEMKSDKTFPRITIRVTEEQHKALSAMSKATGEKTLSNYVRKRLGLPPESRGDRKDLKKPQST